MSKVENNNDKLTSIKEATADSGISPVVNEGVVKDSIDKEKFEEERKKVEDFLLQLDKEDKKVILTVDFSVATKKNLFFVVEELKALKQEVESKKSLALQKGDIIKSKVQFLLKSGKVHVDEKEYEKSDASVKQYVNLLEDIFVEVGNEVSFYSKFLSDDLPPTIVVSKYESDLFDDFITRRIKFIKKYVKGVKRDLNVSYSRYSFGFDAQIRRMTEVEQYVKYVQDVSDKLPKKTNKQATINT